jgi:hypothetical protein
MEMIHLGSLLFLGALILVVRPVAVALSTMRTDLTWKEKAFIAWMAPRGIVAAAMASLLSAELVKKGISGAEVIEPVVFLVIVGTVGFHGLTARPVANWLGVAKADPQGLLVIGAHRWARKIAQAVKEEGFKVLLVDTNYDNVVAANQEGLDAARGNILHEHTLEDLNLASLGSMVALTMNDEANAFAAVHCSEIFGRRRSFYLPPHGADGDTGWSSDVPATMAFSADATYQKINDWNLQGAQVVRILLGLGGVEAMKAHIHADLFIPFFIVRGGTRLSVYQAGDFHQMQEGDRLIGLDLTVEPWSGSGTRIREVRAE